MSPESQDESDVDPLGPESEKDPLAPESETDPLAPEFETDPLGSGPKFWVALVCYGVLALLAWLTLDGKIRLVVIIALAGLTLKTYLAKLQKP